MINNYTFILSIFVSEKDAEGIANIDIWPVQTGLFAIVGIIFWILLIKDGKRAEKK